MLSREYRKLNQRVCGVVLRSTCWVKNIKILLELSFQRYFLKDGDLSLFHMGYIILINMHPGKASFIFSLGESLIKFNGNFDSGNLKHVTQITPFQVWLWWFSTKFRQHLTHIKYLQLTKLFFTSISKEE